MNNQALTTRQLFPIRLLALLGGLILLWTGCMVGPKYQRPGAPFPPAYKEPPTDNSQELTSWKAAQPSEGEIRGNWWQVYNDPQLNSLEEQVTSQTRTFSLLRLSSA